MDPTLISFAIRAAFRLGSAGKLAFEQHARDKEVLLPDAFVNRMSDRDELIALVLENFDELCAPGMPCQAYWEQNAPKKDAQGSEEASILHLRAGLIRIEAIKKAKTEGIRQEDAESVAGVTLVEQWRKGDGPPHPWIHIAVTVVDLGLEFVASKPELLGLNGNGAKIVGSVAGSLASVIPEDTGEFDLKAVFGERLIAAFLRGALQGVSQNADGIFREKHLQQLVTSTLGPVIAQIEVIESDRRIDTQEWASLVETLAGPAAQTAIGVIAEHPEAFLGESFETEKATGALARALLTEAASRSLRDNFSEAGLVSLFRAGVGVAAARPELFLGKADDEIEKVSQELFAKVMEIFQVAESPFSGDVVLRIAAAGLDTFKENAALLVSAGDDWNELVAASVGLVTDGFKEGFLRADGKSLEAIFSREKLVELGRVFLIQVAENPKMVTGTVRDAQGREGRTKEIKRVVAAVAWAMSADENLLLSNDDWIVIADVAVQEAAANAGPLFGLDDDNPKDAAALAAIRTLLAAAHESIDGTKRVHGQILFGATLRYAIVETLKLLPRNVRLLTTDAGVDNLKTLITETLNHVAENKDRLGSTEWLTLYLFLLKKLLAGEPFNLPAPDEIKKIINEE